MIPEADNPFNFCDGVRACVCFFPTVTLSDNKISKEESAQRPQRNLLDEE